MEFKLTPEDLMPLIRAAVAECYSRLPVTDDRMAYSEQEAAEMLGVTRTTLRDERRRGRIEAAKVGRRIRYTREQLLAYLARRKWEPKQRKF